MLKRLFLAIPLPKSYLDTLGELAEKYHFRGVRWTAKQNLHITVLFLGDVREEYIDKLTTTLKDIKNIAPFSLNFKELAFAPPNRSPRMIWGVFETTPAFDNLVRQCFDLSKRFCRLNPPYRQIPHITLARFKDYADWRKIKLPQLSFEPLEVKKIRLMESILTREGPIYQELGEIRFPLDKL